jgi:hypothetical protein
MNLTPDNLSVVLAARRHVPDSDADAFFNYVSTCLRRCGDEPREVDVRRVADAALELFGRKRK